MMRKEQRRLVWILLFVTLLVVNPILSNALAPGHIEYLKAGQAVRPGVASDQETAKSVMRDTPFQALVPTLFGVREVMAALMWVQADSYFHRGEYRPIIRMVKQITAIDPHQLDVYATGAWHMAYNFMDKRLIEDGVKFLEEGSKNNQTVYDLFFELGYMHYDKTKDFPQAVAAYRESTKRGTTTGKTTPPSYVRHQLAHALEKMGDIDQCLQQWEDNLKLGRELLEKKDEKDAGAAGVNLSAARHNLYITARRRNERLAAVAERAKNAAEAKRLWEANVALADEWLKEFPGHQDVSKDRQTAINNVERLAAGTLRPAVLTNLDFDFTVTRIAPRKLEIVGTLDVLNLSRVNLRFQDKNYAERSKDFDFKMQNCTLEWDNVPVNKGQFKWTLNLDRDPAEMERAPSEIYPLKADEYELTLTYNPRYQAAFIQDVYGWNGEGLTAKKEYLNEDASRAGVIDGKKIPLRTVSRTVVLKRDDIVGEGKKVLFSGK